MNAKLPPLTPEEEYVLLRKGTEAPFCSKYLNNKQEGSYVCRACGLPLYKSADKFESGCGWPSFDDELPGAVAREPDPDGRRVEILCANCRGHLGHIFAGEGFTRKNIRHCVNSVSMHFVPKGEELPEVDRKTRDARTKSAVFAGGCFWGLEHAFRRERGVTEAISGYCGGHLPDPSYEQVSSGHTGHAEAVQVVYDPSAASYEALARLFFELHDPTEINRQGFDIGTQYRSALFYNDEEEKEIALGLIEKLQANGYAVFTQVVPAAPFYPAEDYHQRYLEKHPNRPSCHRRVRRFTVKRG